MTLIQGLKSYQSEVSYLVVDHIIRSKIVIECMVVKEVALNVPSLFEFLACTEFEKVGHSSEKKKRFRRRQLMSKETGKMT